MTYLTCAIFSRSNCCFRLLNEAMNQWLTLFLGERLQQKQSSFGGVRASPSVSSFVCQRVSEIPDIDPILVTSRPSGETAKGGEGKASAGLVRNDPSTKFKCKRSCHRWQSALCIDLVNILTVSTLPMTTSSEQLAFA